MLLSCHSYRNLLTYLIKPFCSTLVIMRESLQGVEKRKEKREERRKKKRRGTEIGIETETERGEEAKTGKGTERRIGIGIGIGTGIETETMIDITEIATGIEVREGNVGEKGMTTMTILIAVETMIGNVY